MTDIVRNRPAVEYPPTLNDLLNIQHYITSLETELNDGVDTTKEIIEYGSSLLVLSELLEEDGFFENANAMKDLGELALGALIIEP
jgi:hypothetical protein